MLAAIKYIANKHLPPDFVPGLGQCCNGDVLPRRVEGLQLVMRVSDQNFHKGMLRRVLALNQMEIE